MDDVVDVVRDAVQPLMSMVLGPNDRDLEGAWGQPTSTLDWCEENYVVSSFIAEFWNTLSNVFMIIPTGVSAYYYWKIGMELRFVILNVAVLVVGIGSWLFHMTLKYEMQLLDELCSYDARVGTHHFNKSRFLLDELTMIYAGCILAYALMNSHRGPGEHDQFEMKVVAGYAVFITVLYLVLQNPVFHEIAYGVIVIKLVYDGLQIGKKFPKLVPLHYSSIICYGIGFFLWILDNNFCEFLRDTRESSYIAPLYQLHAWWHVLTGYGTFVHIVFSLGARLLFLKRQCTIEFVGIFPYIELKD